VTHLKLSRKLNYSKSNIERMASLGMPCSSEQAARQWIKARSKENPQAQAAQTLADKMDVRNGKEIMERIQDTLSSAPNYLKANKVPSSVMARVIEGISSKQRGG
jgi:hypothetical protein